MYIYIYLSILYIYVHACMHVCVICLESTSFPLNVSCPIRLTVASTYSLLSKSGLAPSSRVRRKPHAGASGPVGSGCGLG